VLVAVEEILRRLVAPLIAPAGDVTPSPLGETLRGAVSKANARIKRELPGAGTTLTVALVIDDSVAVAHVGDSRAYLCHRGEVRQLTRDHSLTARLVETGQQTPAEAAEDPRRNMLYRALGQLDALEVDFQFQEFPPGSRLLLCSDGLWGVLPDGELERVLREASDPAATCQELVTLANQRGGPDNITVLVAINDEAEDASRTVEMKVPASVAAAVEAAPAKPDGDPRRG
jgi:protein phosphatase